jgi:hypothetical protein
MKRGHDEACPWVCINNLDFLSQILYENEYLNDVDIISMCKCTVRIIYMTA